MLDGIAQRNFRPNGVYLLDEPEAALSPQRQLTLLSEIAHCAAAGSQFILVTHSPILLGMPDAEILSFDGKKIHPISYEETDSYRVTRMFLEDRKRLLHQLMYMPEAAEELQKAAAQALDKRHAEYLKNTCRKEIKSRLRGKRV